MCGRFGQWWNRNWHLISDILLAKSEDNCNISASCNEGIQYIPRVVIICCNLIFLEAVRMPRRRKSELEDVFGIPNSPIRRRYPKTRKHLTPIRSPRFKRYHIEKNLVPHRAFYEVVAKLIFLFPVPFQCAYVHISQGLLVSSLIGPPNVDASSLLLYEDFA